MHRRSKDEESNEKLITDLYYKYSKLMRSEANNILKDYALAEDAVHQAFIRVIKNIEKIKHGDSAKVRSYLVIICRNIAIDIYKQRLYLNEHSTLIDLETEENIIDYQDPSMIVLDNEFTGKIAECIKKLPPIYRDVLLLEKLHHNSKHEIAELLGINYETIRKRSLRAKKMLFEALEKEDDLI